MLLYSESSASGAGMPAARRTSKRRLVLAGSRFRWTLAAATVSAVLLAVVPGICQTTTLNLATQGRNPDFSNFPVTKPISVGAIVPATCQVGQLFFNTAAAAGANLVGCTAVNTWTVLGGAGGSGGSSGSTGNGIATLNTQSVSFGNATVSNTAPAQPVLLSNTGSGALSISGITLSGSNAADFMESSNCGSSVATGATCTIAIAFTPSNTAAETATLTITDNGAGSPHTVSLSGTGVSAAAAVGPGVTPASPATSVGTPLNLTASRSVTWSLAPGSRGTLSSSGTSAVYTPPASVPAPANYAGCLVAPSDSIFNTRIDNLPVHSQSATWMNSFISPISFLLSWGTNLIDNTLPTTPMFFHYTTNYNGNFQIPTGSNRKRETGALTVDPNNDHHMVSVNHQTCVFTETYQDGLSITGCPACNAGSGYRYSANSYAMPTQGTTDAAGLPLGPLSVHMGEIKAGAITHALRFTLCTGCINSATFLWPATQPNGSTTPSAPPMGARFRLKKSFNVSGLFGINVTNPGSGYSSSPSVTITGCQTAPSATALVSGSGTVASIVVNSAGANCSNPTVTIGGPGTGAQATATAFSPVAQVLLTGLQQFGMFLADNGLSGQIETDSDLAQDPAIISAVNEIGNARLGASNFEVVDESSLMVSSNSSQVNPNNGYVTPANYAVVTATDTQGNTTTLPIALQPVLVGVPYPKMTILAGMTGYQLQSWVNGSSNQNVTWTLTSGPGSVTSGGLYSPPATVSSPTPVVLTASAAADSTASTNVWLTVIPAGANPVNSIRIDVGSNSPYTDTLGNAWLPDTLGWESGQFSNQNDNYPSNAWNNIPDQTLYQTYNYTDGDDITYGPFVVPNGNYKVGFSIARAECTGSFNESDTFNSGLIWGAVNLEAQGQIGLHFDIAKQVYSACRTPYTAFVPAVVTNNVLFAAIRVTGGSQNHSVATLAALQVIPDTTTPHLNIDTAYQNTLKSGTVAQLYAIGWYMSNAVTWSVTGGGSIDQTGVYTAPASVSSNTTVTVTITSQSNSSISASVPLTVTP